MKLAQISKPTIIALILGCSNLAYGQLPEYIKMCNKSQQELTFKFTSSTNIKVKLPGQTRYNEKWEFNLSPMQCGNVAVMSDFKDSSEKVTEVKIGTYFNNRFYGDFMFKSDPGDIAHYDRNTIHWTANDYKVSNDDYQFDIEALGVKSLKIYNGTPVEKPINGKISLADKSIGGRTSIFPNSNTQELDFRLIRSNSKFSNTDIALAQGVKALLNTAFISSRHKIEDRKNLMRNSAGEPLPLYPEITVCKVYDPIYEPINPSNIDVEWIKSTIKNSTPVFIGDYFLKNNSSTTQNLKTAEFKITQEAVVSTKVESGTQADFKYELSAKLKTPVSEKKITFSDEYSVSTAHGKSVETKKADSIWLWPQTIDVAPHSEVEYKVELLKGKLNGEFVVNYPLQQATARVDILPYYNPSGVCRANDPNLIKNISVNVPLLFALSKNSAPEKYGVNSLGVPTVRNVGVYTSNNLGYEYKITINRKGGGSSATPQEIYVAPESAPAENYKGPMHNLKM